MILLTLAQSPTSILILNTEYSSNPPVITDTLGAVELLFEFEMNIDTEVYNSCSLTFKGKFYVFGGSRKRTQISQINKCKLERIGSLQFSFFYGACTNVNDMELYLCFDLYNNKMCRKSIDPLGPFTLISDSISTHSGTRIANDGGELKF